MQFIYIIQLSAIHMITRGCNEVQLGSSKDFYLEHKQQ